MSTQRQLTDRSGRPLHKYETNPDQQHQGNAKTHHLLIKRAARLLQRSGDLAYAKYTVALRLATVRASADPEWAHHFVQQHLADRDNARDGGRDPGRFGTPFSDS